MLVLGRVTSGTGDVGTKIDLLTCQPGTKIIPQILIAAKQHHQDSTMKDSNCVEEKYIAVLP